MRPATPDRRERAASAAVLLALAVPAILFTGQFPPLFNPNELSRLAAVYSFVETGSFAIDGAAARFHLVEDVSKSNGRLYSNKAPGLTLAAIPVYRVLRVVFPPPSRADAAVFDVLRLLVVTPVCLLALARFLAWMRRRATPSRAGPLVAAAVALGSPFLFYSRSFFSHAWTASLLFLALDRIRAGEEASSTRRVGFLFWVGGLLAGWAAISEYPTALVAGMLWLRTASRRSPMRAAFFGLGLLAPLGVLLAYDAACFGSPFVLSSAREGLPEYAKLAGEGLFGFGWPSPRIALAYLFHPARGLVLFSPFWIWAIAGFEKWRRTREDRRDWAFCLAAVVVYFVAMTAYPNWHGGWSFGDRYLLPLLFPAGLALSRALESPASRWWFAAAAVFAIATHEAIASTWVHYPTDVPWPAKNGALWFLAHGWTPRTIFGGGVAVGLVCVGLTLVAAAAACAASLGCAGLPRGRAIWAAAVGLAAFAAMLVLAPPLNFHLRAWRAEVFGTASGRDPGFSELRRELAMAETPAERRRAEQYRRRYRLTP